MSENKTLIIWMSNGSTLKFEKVEDLTEHDDSITFGYFGVSTQVKIAARFHCQNIAGYAWEV